MHSWTNSDIRDVTDFCIEHGNGLHSKSNYCNLLKNIKGHFDCKTIIVVRDEKGISAIGRWNLITEDTAHILDLIIRKDNTTKNLMKRMLLLGQRVFPSAKYIIFERLKKYPSKKQSKCSIERLLKRRG